MASKARVVGPITFLLISIDFRIDLKLKSNKNNVDQNFQAQIRNNIYNIFDEEKQLKIKEWLESNGISPFGKRKGSIELLCTFVANLDLPNIQQNFNSFVTSIFGEEMDCEFSVVDETSNVFGWNPYTSNQNLTPLPKPSETDLEYSFSELNKWKFEKIEPIFVASGLPEANKPSSFSSDVKVVVIIGGGPVGLAMASAIKTQVDVKVVVVEHRQFARVQVLTISKSSNALLEQWVSPNIKAILYNSKGYLDEISGDGYISIRELQTQLKGIAVQNGCEFVDGEAIAVNDSETAITVRLNSGKDQEVPFDVLIVANGKRSNPPSKIHASLNLGLRLDETKSYPGHGLVATYKNPSKKPMTLYSKLQDGWLLRIFCTSETIYLAMGCSAFNCPRFEQTMLDKDIYLPKIRQLLKALVEEFDETADERVNVVQFFFTSLSAPYRQLSKSKKHVLVVGDAAHTTSFFTGSGANFGFLSLYPVVDFMRNGEVQQFLYLEEENTKQMKKAGEGFIPYIDQE